MMMQDFNSSQENDSPIEVILQNKQSKKKQHYSPVPCNKSTPTPLSPYHKALPAAFRSPSAASAEPAADDQSAGRPVQLS